MTQTLQETMFAQLAGKDLFAQAAAYAYAYIDEVNERPVAPTPQALRDLALFDEGLPQSPQPADAILEQLHAYGSPATSAQLGGRYFGFVNGSALPAALAARWLADVWDQNAAMHLSSPIAAKLEQICEAWLVDLLNLPPTTAAGLVSGTSTATMCGLAAGRNWLLQKQGWDANSDGLFGAPPLRVVISEAAHASVFKGLALLGLGRKRVELAPADSQGRIDARRLPPLDGRTLLLLQAGNVNTGAFDDFSTLCRRANEAGAWIHIDGAFGLWAAASPTYGHLTQGMETAHSWSVDAHKTLNTPYDCGIILCKEREALAAAMQASGSYLHYSAQRDNMRYTPEMSRRARGVELWAALKFLGRDGVAELVDALCARAAQFAALLRANGFQVRNDVVFNQVLVAAETPPETEALLAAVQASGECWCGGTSWQGAPAIRLSVCSWATTPADIERALQAFIKARDSLR